MVAGKVYTMKSPTIRVMCRAISEFSRIDTDFSEQFLQSVFSETERLRLLVKGIAYLIVGNQKNYEQLAEETAEELMDGSIQELSEAFNAFLEMTSLGEVFQVAASARKFAEVAAKQK